MLYLNGDMMYIAHTANYAPGLSGLYGTTRDLVLAERELGHTAELIDDAQMLQDQYGLDGITPVPASWGDRADVVCWHHAIVEEWLNEPHRNLVVFLHGTPEYNLFTELYDGDKTMSLLIGLANRKIPKAFISMWQRHIPIWENLLQQKVHYVPAWTNPSDFTVSKKKVDPKVIKIGLLDYWRKTREPFGIIEAIEELVKHSDKKIEVDAWGIAEEPSKTWLAVVQWLVEKGVMTLKGRSTNVQEDLYEKCDMIVSMSTEETRVVRESYSAGVPVVCARSKMPFTKYSEDCINPDKLAEVINKCHDDLCKDQDKIRKRLRNYAVKNFDVKKSAKQVIKIFEDVIEEYGSPNNPKINGTRMVASVHDTADKIRDRLKEGKPTAYIRFGDGELLFMSQDIKEGGMHKCSSKLSKDLIKSFKYADLKTMGYFVSSSAGIINEGRMRKGVFGAFESDEKLIEIVNKYRPDETLDNYIALAYKSVFEPQWFVDFLKECVHGKRVLFIGGEVLCESPMIKRAFDVDTFIPLPMRDAYYALNKDKMKEIEVASQQHDIIICAAGMCANVICHRLWSKGFRTDFLDIGSIADALVGIGSRTWIRVVGEDYINNYRRAFMPLKSDVIVLSHNQPEITKRCFESIKENTDNYRLIWVDNGSDEENLEKMKESVADLGAECNLIASKFNRGFSGGVNLALRQSLADKTCDWVVLLNNDVIVSKNWLENLISCGIANNLDVVGPLTSENNPQSLDAIRDIVEDLPQFANESIDERNSILHNRYGDKAVEVSGMLSFYCCAIRREIIEQTGLLDENIFAYGEDNDYCQRLSMMKRKLGISLGTYVHHDHHATSSAMGEKWIEQQKKKAKKYLNEKWSKIIGETDEKTNS